MGAATRGNGTGASSSAGSPSFASTVNPRLMPGRLYTKPSQEFGLSTLPPSPAARDIANRSSGTGGGMPYGRVAGGRAGALGGVGGPVVQAVVVRAYTSPHQGDLVLEKGQVLRVLSMKTDPQWWFGRVVRGAHASSEGWFPKMCVEMLTGATPVARHPPRQTPRYTQEHSQAVVVAAPGYHASDSDELDAGRRKSPWATPVVDTT